MDIIEVEITGQVITARYGTLKCGDVVRTDLAYAKHLVEDCAAAKYRGVPGAKADHTVPEKKAKKAAPENK